MAVIKEKDEEFSERITGWDVVGLVETWLELKDWEKWNGRMPKKFK